MIPAIEVFCPFQTRAHNQQFDDPQVCPTANPTGAHTTNSKKNAFTPLIKL
jgi:hypothetical protein